MEREIDNRTYLKYILHSLKVDELKQICRDYKVRGYSKYKKADLIEFILDSLAEEEMTKIITEKEPEIISKEFNTAIDIINGKGRETLEEIEVVNPDRNEIELSFKGFNWTVHSFLSITQSNIKDPLRDCDCRTGANMGLCEHFWVGFIFSLKNGYFNLSDWTLTTFPKELKNQLESIKITTQEGTENQNTEKSGILIDENSDSSHLMEHLDSRITVLESSISEVLKRESEFQEIITTYYVLKAENVKFVPQVKKISDAKKEDIVEVDELNIRLSENAYEKVQVEKGDKFSCNGTVNRDNFWGYILKRATKYKKL